MIYTNGNIEDIKVGNDPIHKIYLGQDLVWQKKQKPLMLEYEIEDLSKNTIVLPFPVPADRIIVWGDGIIEEVHTGFPSHTYLNEGRYTVSIYKEIQSISSSFVAVENREQLRKVISWGDFSLHILSMQNAFINCAGLTSIPNDEYGAFNTVKTFLACFSGCQALSEIPEGLFKHSYHATTFQACFRNCLLLDRIPETLFTNCSKVTDFCWCFYDCQQLRQIPEKLFENCIHATIYERCFHNCNMLSEIPEKLFENCTDVTDFTQCFSSCQSLLSIPGNLFKNNTQVTIFTGCFADCGKLYTIPENLFQNNTQVRFFNSCFIRCVALKGMTPKDEDGGELWEREGKPGYPDSIVCSFCFSRCYDLDNYSEIPEDWK